jgi:hypothetical protein
MKREMYLCVIITLGVVFAAAQAGFHHQGCPDKDGIVPPEASFIEQLTAGDVNNSNISIFGSRAVWQGKEPNGGPTQIFYFDGNDVTQITDGNTNNIRPQIYGSNIVWQGRDTNEGDWEIFWSNGQSIFQITDNNFNDINPRVSASRIFWKGLDGNDWQIFTAALPIGITMKVSPETINLKSRGQTILVAIWLGTNLKAIDVNISSLRLMDQVAPSKVVVSTGSNKLILKFDRQAVQSLLQVGNKVAITLTGKMNDGTVIMATDTVKVIQPGKK